MHKSTSRIGVLLGAFLLMALTIACAALGGFGPEEGSISIRAEPEGGEVGEGSAGGDFAEFDAGLCEHPFYPVHPASSWTYRGQSGTDGPYQWTDTLSNIQPDGFSLTSVYEGVTRVQSWRCTPEGLVSISIGGGPAGSVTTSDISLEMETSNIRGVTLPREIRAGDRWSHSMDAEGTIELALDTEAEVEGHAEYNHTAIGRESVSVGEATYDAFRIDTTFTLDIAMNMEGGVMPMVVTSSGSSWWVEGIGWVLATSEGTVGDFAMVDTIELIDFSVP